MAEITVFIKNGGALTKRISLDHGKIKPDGSACVMSRGRAFRFPITSLGELADIVSALESTDAIALGRLRDGLPDEVEIGSLRQVNGTPTPNLVARTLANVVFSDSLPAIALLDYDRKGMPPEVAAKIDALGGFWNALVSVAPDLKPAAHMIRQSTSSGLYHGTQRFAGSGGLHVYIMVEDGADIPRFLKVLHERCLLAGLGWIMVSASGSLLERSIVDTSVGSPERLVFEAAPILVPPLRQDQAQRRPRVTAGGMVDTRAVALELSVDEHAGVERWRAAQGERLKDEARRVRARWCEKAARKLTQQGLTPEVARTTVERHCNGVLLSPVELAFDDSEFAGKTVADVLAEPERYEELTLADPLEGIAYGRGKAKVLLRDDGGVVVHSFAHGLGRVFALRHDAAAVRKSIDAADKEDAATVWVRLRGQAEINRGDNELLEKHVATRAGIGVKTLRGMEFDARKEAARRSAERENERIHARDERVSLMRPLNDDARWVGTEPPDEALSANARPVPPFRDLDGRNTEARQRIPNHLHLLQDDEGEEDDEED